MFLRGNRGNEVRSIFYELSKENVLDNFIRTKFDMSCSLIVNILFCNRSWKKSDNIGDISWDSDIERNTLSDIELNNGFPRLR